MTAGNSSVLKNSFTISFVRHGKTEGNAKQQYIGFTDQPLSDVGKDELEKFQKSGMYPECERLFLSPMKRCIQTKDLIYGDMPFEVLEGFKEKNFGDYEGLTFDEILSRESNPNWGMTLESMIFPNGESLIGFSNRVMQDFDRMIERLEKEKRHDKISVICHGGTIWCILVNLKVQQVENYVWGALKNGCGIELEYDTVTKAAVVNKKIEPVTVDI